MNIFQTVKQSVSARQAASFYGIMVSGNGMACCPFHDDRHPSMKIDERFYCFGCGEKGDVIDLVAKLHDENPLAAAMRLARDFNVPADNCAVHIEPRKHVSKKSKTGDQDVTDLVRKTMQHYYDELCKRARMFRTICQYLSPENPDEKWHPLFVIALEHAGYVDYLLDVLFYAEWEEKIQVFPDCRKELETIERALNKYIWHVEQSARVGEERDPGVDQDTVPGR